MSRRVSPKTASVFAPANDLLRRVSDFDARRKRQIMLAVAGLFSALFLWSFLAGEYSIFSIWRLSNEKQALLQANRELIAQLIDADRKRTLLQSDPFYIEQIARSKYHMVFPGETVYRIKPR